MIPENCTRCGYCCQQIIRLTEHEVKRIRRLGYDDEYFLDKDFHGNKTLKLINNYCVFLEIKEGIAKCKIYKDRPKCCIEYPRKTRCTLKKHFTFEEK
jgi:Fe-S-cluster containining protein